MLSVGPLYNMSVTDTSKCKDFHVDVPFASVNPAGAALINVIGRSRNRRGHAGKSCITTQPASWAMKMIVEREIQNGKICHHLFDGWAKANLAQ